jgi:hypothetical protein
MTGENIPAIGSINIGCAQHLTSSFIDSPESERDLRVTWISLGPIRLGHDVLDPSKMYSALAGPSQGVSGQNQRSRHASR